MSDGAGAAAAGSAAGRLLVGLDALAFSSLWAAGVAVVLTGASARAMSATIPLAVWALAFGGTLVVYNVDRLRDRERDRPTAPIRTAFVERHHRRLTALAVAGAAVAALGAWPLGPPVWAICGAVGVVGLFHRRLKNVPIFKGLYVAGAWVSVIVGIPACVAPGAERVGWTAVILGAAILGNVIASNVRDAEAGARTSRRAALAAARLIPALGLAAAFLGPEEVRPLAWVPAILLLALARDPRGERYGLVVIDGALLLGGALAALA